jgi:hypothetical protein
MSSDNFIDEVQRFITKAKLSERLDELNCENIFDNEDSYTKEKSILEKIRLGQFSNTKEKGDALEDLVKSLFGRVDLINSVQICNKETGVGQIDIILIVLRDNIYDVWELASEKPQGIIGECKNYSTNKVSRPEIEKTCWRACKSRCLSFFIAPSYTDDSIKEMQFFNLQKKSILTNHDGIYIVPITIEMIEKTVLNNINFCYFIKWAIAYSKNIAPIANYI